MTNPQQKWPRADDIGKASRLCELVLREVITHTTNFLRANLIELFDAFDESAFDAAIAAKDNETQILHFDAMRYVRLHKDRFISLFLFQFESSFEQSPEFQPVNQVQTPEAPSLRNFYELFTENIANVDAMAVKAEAENKESLEHLQLYMQSMQKLRGAANVDNPLEPGQLMLVFSHACRDLTISAEAFFLLLNLWESRMLGKLPALYASTLQILHKSDVAPSLDSLASQADKPQNDEEPGERLESSLQNAQRPFESFRTDSLIPAGSSANSNQGDTQITDLQLIAKLSKLQGPLAQRLKEGKAPQTLDLRRIVDKVLEDNRASGKPGFLTSVQEAAIQSVVFLFQGGANDDDLPVEVRGLIHQLQIPLLKLMLLDNKRFKEGNHPAICLLNEAVCAGFEWSERSDKDDVRFYNELGSIVNSILKHFADDATIFSEKLAQLQNFLSEEHSPIPTPATSVTSASGDAESASVRRVVGAQILRRLKGNLLPPTILDFIVSQWLGVMASCLEKYGAQSPQWHETLQTLDDLIASVQKQDDPQAQARIKQRFSTVRNDVLKGLSRISTDQQHSHRQLERIAAVQEKINKPDSKKDNKADNSGASEKPGQH